MGSIPSEEYGQSSGKCVPARIFRGLFSRGSPVSRESVAPQKRDPDLRRRGGWRVLAEADRRGSREVKSLTIEGNPLLQKEIPYYRTKSLTTEGNPEAGSQRGGWPRRRPSARPARRRARRSACPAGAPAPPEEGSIPRGGSSGVALPGGGSMPRPV